MARAITYLRKLDVGTQIKVHVLDEDGNEINLSTATVKNIVFYLPDKTTVEKPAEFITDGSDGWLKYVTEAGFLSMIGRWKGQVQVVMPAWDGSTSVFEFYVSDRFD